MSAEPHNNIDFWISVGSGLTGVIAGMVAGVSYLKNRFKSWKKQEEIDAICAFTPAPKKI